MGGIMPVSRILAIGDIVGPQAVEYIRRRLWDFRRTNEINLTVANAENACTGNGLDTQTAKGLLASGVDIITSGNHIWHKRDIREYLDSADAIIRPANYRTTTPGSGYTKITVDGYVYLVINVLGVVYMDPLDNPFYTVERILNHERGHYDFAILDIHAEATSEKQALAYFFDGRIHVIFGTHTHVATADERVMPRGSGYITDLGMCGPVNSVLGIRPEIIIEKLTTNMPVRFDIAEGDIEACGAVFTLDLDKKCVVSVERVKI
jgi:metallophosphoesterase (TIGR00282 family)